MHCHLIIKRNFFSNIIVVILSLDDRGHFLIAKSIL